ncbi:hypothetical protein [Parafrankia discariae]|uniref:hypothetical protein n=1 Tax=Parafrankia discariae TaxID=365528 RepID=UPI00037CF531|nr:hypothetical protein [Parafrankia discariae]
MSLLTSLLHDLDDNERDHLLTVIRRNIATELDAVADGATPHRAVDVGTRTRRSKRAATA